MLFNTRENKSVIRGTTMTVTLVMFCTPGREGAANLRNCRALRRAERDGETLVWAEKGILYRAAMKASGPADGVPDWSMHGHGEQLGSPRFQLWDR
jgi:hypothetical protein